MNPLYSDRIDALINAIQLCIRSVIHTGKSPIEGVLWDTSKHTIEICFDTFVKDDEKLDKIKRLLPLEEEYELGFKIKLDFFKSDECKKLTTFLLLTRMDDQNVQKLAEMDSSYAPFLGKLGLNETIISNINNLKDAAAFVFKLVENRQLTLRELSQKTGLTEVALSNFKLGKSDMRLSSFFKITSALGLKLKLQ